MRKDGIIIDDGGHFATKQGADLWLNNLKRDFIFFRVENFLHHKQHIFENAPGHKSLTLKKTILENILKHYRYAVDKPIGLNTFCRWLLEFQEQFHQVLPSEKNPSRESSEEDLKFLMEFAKAQVQFNLLKKAS
jgi:hypothetical protein